MRCSSRAMLRSVTVVSGIALSMTGCAGTPAGAPSPFDGAAGGEPSDAWSPDAIERTEIVDRGRNDHTAMELIRRLRPAWLRARGQNSFTDMDGRYPLVYIDEIRHGSLGTLNRIPSSEILGMQFFSPADATTRWGTGHPSGVINVDTGR